MSYVIKGLREKDVDKILKFERMGLRMDGLGELEAQMEEWKSRWREEALYHYLPQGWSFGSFDEVTGELEAYFIGKVIPFFRSYTQVLWVERIHSDNPQMKMELIEVAYRYAREKHLQQVMFEGNEYRNLEVAGKCAQAAGGEFYIIKTTKNED